MFVVNSRTLSSMLGVEISVAFAELDNRPLVASSEPPVAAGHSKRALVVVVVVVLVVAG